MGEYGTLNAAVRDGRGKGAARSLRREGRIPAVLYGGGQDNVSLSLDPNEFRKATDPDKKWNTFFSVTVKGDGGEKLETCVLTDVQVDIVRRDVIHVDFMRVNPEEDVIRKIPVRFTGRSVGVVKGGKLKTFRRTVRVAAKPINIPVELVVDITALDAGESLRMQDVDTATGRLEENPEHRLCFIELPKAKQEDEEGEEKKEEKKEE